ncbi:MerR family transcriptional regulator [Nocardia sp. CNY236]|uniref:MerR family transcriptional regulator n=1 Tax=Nocardia sp. CNY236 TaxID=1169152 RepID=UPI00041DD834|nr:MerR family transcriptional regulator [Nocardia sp. CNY236]
MTIGAHGRYLQIGQVAERSELSVKTIRHYDDVGLVVPSARSAGGFRLYTETDVSRLLLVRRLKPLGFSLAETKQLLDAFDLLDSDTASDQQRDRAKEFLLGYRSRTHDSAERLRHQLAHAEEFIALLTASTVFPDPPRAPSRRSMSDRDARA